MTTVVAFILEAFLFRIRYRAKMQGHDTDGNLRYVIMADCALARDIALVSVH